MFDFQRALTSERVYQDLVKRVALVKLKLGSGNGTHYYHNARLQLWHENPPADALVTDAASGMTGVSKAARAKLVLQCSRLMIYFGGSFLTCFLTDDITLKRDGHELMLVPTKYKGSLMKSPKTVKAVIRGNENSKGGFRLDKEKISPDDEYKFEEYSYIHINFKDTEYLNKFQKLWNEMMAARRAKRKEISSLKEQLQAAARAPLAVS
ncbi:unnamed protein product [Tuber melanosporum]|jgi:hypothetical protein|uniref:(Perigord truffle) hypothetical protein n=1 Tax=Tuber melanosporum (strain Mel28) TaxID=656061 RepID=D5GBX5_TUBMM|nr:uncharacterized protein GSTUM_00005630001 [Tuber melanosporum]CAZ81975.1 unnamed protein product [Tuber melanosporum]